MRQAEDRKRIAEDRNRTASWSKRINPEGSVIHDELTEGITRTK